MVYLVTQSCLTVCDPVDCSLPGSSLHGDSPSKNTGVAWHFFLQGSFLTWGLNWGLHHCRHSLPSEPPGKPENAGVGSLSLLQGIFLTQELKWGSPVLQADSLPAEVPVGDASKASAPSAETVSKVSLFFCLFC